MHDLIEHSQEPLARPAGRSQTLMCLACIAASLLFSGCFSTEVVTGPPTIVEKAAARPSRILVYDYAATVEDVPTDAALGARLSARTSVPPEQLALDRQLGVKMSAQLIQFIRDLGLPAERALSTTALQVNDVVVRGYLVSIHQNTNGARFNVGLDLSATEIMTAIENFHVTEQGLARSLGSKLKTPSEKALAAATGAESNPGGFIGTSQLKTGGAAIDRAKLSEWAGQSVNEAAERLKARFKEQGWIP